MRTFLWALLVVIVLVPRHAVGAGFLDENESVARVFVLIDQRLALMSDVAAWKWVNQKAILDPPRERAVIDRAVEKAALLGLSGSEVRVLLEKQIRLANAVQEDLHAQWRRTGYGASRVVPSLEAELRPKLDELSVQLLRSLYLAASMLSRTDFTAVYGPLAKREWRSPGWADESRAEILDAVAKVRRVPAPALGRIRTSGVLRIGTTGDYEPFSLFSEGKLSGTDIERARALAEKLAVEPIFIRTSWPTLMADFRADKFDIAISGISITPERQVVAAFSAPYHSGGKTILSRRVDADRFGSLTDVDRSGVRVIVNPGGTNEQYVREHIRHATIRVFPDNRTIFEEIRAGRADVMITDDTEADWQARKHNDLVRAMQGTLTRADKAIMMPRDAALVGIVDQWLAAKSIESK